MTGEDRTEAATPKKRQELRRRGQVARSQDLSSMVVFLAVVICLHSAGGAAFDRLRDFLKGALGSTHEAGMTPGVILTEGGSAMKVLFVTTGPLFVTAMLVGLLVNVVQTGFLVSTHALKPDFTKLNPLAGMKRFVSARGLVETVKNLARLTIIGWLVYSTILGAYPELLQGIRQDHMTFLAVIGDVLYRLTLRICICLLVMAALDYAYQRWSFEKSIRMTKEEVKQESKTMEGNPLVKSRIRARQRQIARQRMMDAVPAADVIITNPTHFAVALKYDQLSMAAPQVVAKGGDHIAAKIREIAEENDVPIVENPPLARGLFRAVEVGQQVPSEFFAAVAEILAFVYRLNKRRTG
jgi:flagellar biosynthetic protein FlhB